MVTVAAVPSVTGSLCRVSLRSAMFCVSGSGGIPVCYHAVASTAASSFNLLE